MKQEAFENWVAMKKAKLVGALVPTNLNCLSPKYRYIFCKFRETSKAIVD